MAVANVPPPPGRLSTTTCWPQVSLIFNAIRRARRSVALPAVNGMIRRTGLVGKFCDVCAAIPGAAASAMPVATKVTNVVLCKARMGLLLLSHCCRLLERSAAVERRDHYQTTLSPTAYSLQFS